MKKLPDPKARGEQLADELLSLCHDKETSADVFACMTWVMQVLWHAWKQAQSRRAFMVRKAAETTKESTLAAWLGTKVGAINLILRTK